MRARAVASVAAALLAGCSLWVGGEQCVSDDDCSLERTGVAGLQCLDAVCQASSDLADSTTSTMSTTSTGSPDTDTGSTTARRTPPANETSTSMPLASDSTTSAPLSCEGRPPSVDEPVIGVYAFTGSVGVSEAQVRLCSLADLDCAAPVFEGAAGAEGLVTLPNPGEDFVGYFEVVADGYVPFIVMIVPPGLVDLYNWPDTVTAGPFEGTENLTTSVALLGMLEYMSIGLLIEAPIDPTLGLVSATATPCLLEQGLLEVRMREAGETSVNFCLDGPVVRPSLEDRGSCGVTNVPAGLATMDLVEVGEPDNIVATQLVISRPGWLTSLAFFPWSEAVDEPPMVGGTGTGGTTGTGTGN